MHHSILAGEVLLVVTTEAGAGEGRPQQIFLRGGVRVVALCALAVFHGGMHVFRLEVLLLVAAEAGLQQRLVEQVFLRGGVRVVALGALAVLHGGMHHSLLAALEVLLLVALEAGFGQRVIQQIFLLGFVGIVAFGTTAFLHGLVDGALLPQEILLLVAAEAGLQHWPLQQGWVVRLVGVVALHALAVFHGGVQHLLFLHLLEVLPLVAIEAEFRHVLDKVAALSQPYVVAVLAGLLRVGIVLDEALWYLPGAGGILRGLLRAFVPASRGGRYDAIEEDAQGFVTDFHAPQKQSQ